MSKDEAIPSKKTDAGRISVATSEGVVQILEGHGESLMTIEAGPAFSRRIPAESSDVALQTVGSFTKALLVHAAAGSGDDRWNVFGELGPAGVTAAQQVFDAFGEDQVEPRRQLRPNRVHAVKHATGEIVGLLTSAAYEREITDDQLVYQAQAAVDAFRVLLSGTSRELRELVANLDQTKLNTKTKRGVSRPANGEPSDEDLEELRARARLRLNALYRKIMEESVTVRQLREEWGLTRQRVAQMRDERKLFAIKVPYHRELFHPAWQFASDHQPRPEMPVLLNEAVQANLDAVDFHQLMTGRRSGRPTGVELLDANRTDAAVALIRAVDR